MQGLTHVRTLPNEKCGPVARGPGSSGDGRGPTDRTDPDRQGACLRRGQRERRYGAIVRADMQVRFEHSEISLDIPNEGKVTEEGWRIMPSTCPTVSDTELCIQESLLSTFAKNDGSTTPCIHYQ